VGDGDSRGQLGELEELFDGDVLRWTSLRRHGIDAVVTTRSGGVSCGVYESRNLGLHVGDDPDAVVENRRRAADSVGAAIGDLVVGTQVHGTVTAVVGNDDRGRGSTNQAGALAGVDALVTASPGVVLMTVVADCAPILLFDPEAGVVATVHAGWRGTVDGVVGAAIDAARTLGARPDRMLAVVGPTADPATYEVGDEVADGIRRRLGDQAGDVLNPTRPGHWLFDIPEANRRLLLAAGLAPGSVATSRWTTNDERFFSDRRQRPCGRFALLARLAP